MAGKVQVRTNSLSKVKKALPGSAHIHMERYADWKVTAVDTKAKTVELARGTETTIAYYLPTDMFVMVYE